MPYDRRYGVALRDGMWICRTCIAALTTGKDVAQAGRCAFCRAAIGGREGFLWRKRRTAVVSRNRDVVCGTCFTMLKDILAEYLLDERRRAI